ncbi:hypothetical protein EK21DRAFT_83191 [Setomelanomma holmii]|uniref:Histone-lysine N-methyltransferase SET9 n=1 Tax=Setomelanomma holmii TaxID=210430 RepID=A0A9P4GV03_9PLEO|nr:hypothetical protein EK21DRAFT_83191 [Setomelanomma holmii]
MSPRKLLLEKLALCDNVTTDILIDKVCLERATRKIHCSTHFSRTVVQQHDVVGIIRSQVVQNDDAMEGVRQLLLLPDLRAVTTRLDDGSDLFPRHLAIYVHMYLRDCPFEIMPTQRYNGTGYNVSITARRNIKTGEKIRYLVGIRVPIDEGQEESLAAADSDFSLIISSRQKTCSLLLGPARFANHDCNANAKLMAADCDGIQVVAVKPICIGDEVTVFYGSDYFGDGNEGCLCHTCELLQQNDRRDTEALDTCPPTRITRSKSRHNNDRLMPPAIAKTDISKDFRQSMDGGTCSECSVRQKQYTTPEQCLRCTRHFSLYGYRWPSRGEQNHVRHKRSV